MEKTLIYPLDANFLPCLKYRTQFVDNDIIGVCVPKGWAREGTDVGQIANQRDIGIVVSNNFNQMLSHCDTVLFCETQGVDNINVLIEDKIYKSIQNGKNVICTARLDDKLIKEYAAKAYEKDLKFQSFDGWEKTDINVYEISDEEPLAQINVPVIFVFGMGEGTYKFEIQLGLREAISQMGYRISQIGSRNYSSLFGFHAIPDFMFDSHVNECKKIIAFNRFVKKIEVQESPELIIIGIPGGVAPFNFEYTNHFGVLAFLISQAVKSDISIFSNYYQDYELRYYEQLKDMLLYRFDAKPDCFNISNLKIDWSKVLEGNYLDFTIVNLDQVDNHINDKKMIYPLYNILNKEDMYCMANYIIDKLNNYGKALSI